jgi:hypothetical protein
MDILSACFTYSERDNTEADMEGVVAEMCDAKGEMMRGLSAKKVAFEPVRNH